MKTGTIKFFNVSKGYGFVKDDETGQEVFVHATGLIDQVRQDDKVTFEIAEGKKGLNAVNVKKV
ncbi:MAG: cold shock domain-containing protein [Bacteroidetes bacterium]|nr:cold shock domain-containing protein [Bacteroidota bacterium]MBL7892919.1 cold shock domain-containing protein [Bacteroidia bacterium]